MAPGSEMLGVPASDIKEIIYPSLINFIILVRFFFSLNLWFEIKLDLIWSNILKLLLSN